jgi:hypothetical protein
MSPDPFPPKRLHAALAAVPADAWSNPSEYTATGVHHGYRRVVLVDHGAPRGAAALFRFVLDRFDPVHDAWLSWIDPGGFIVPHRDGGPYLERWQVPVSTAGWFQQLFDMTEAADGTPFPVCHWTRHAVGNPTDRARVHVVIDRKVRLDRESLPFKTFPVPEELEALVAASHANPRPRAV